MDVLSDVLKAIRLDAALYFHGEFSAPWAVRSGPTRELAPLLSATPGHLTMFHLITQGHGYVRLDEGLRQPLREGDIVVLPHGDSHTLGNSFPERPVDATAIFSQSARNLGIVRHGGGGELTRFVCGFVACSLRLGRMVLSALPRILVVPLADTPSDEWLKRTMGLLGSGEPGTVDALIQTRLSEVLFLETLRRYIAGLPESETGWLAGARDVSVGGVLAALHGRPEFPWTLESLGRAVGQSRSRLAERFQRLMGVPPMVYLTRWRLTLGAERLATTNDSVAAIAQSVGYGSEAGFSRAFRREFGEPPAQYRRSQGRP